MRTHAQQRSAAFGRLSRAAETDVKVTRGSVSLLLLVPSPQLSDVSLGSGMERG